jgi:hypothetical protein
MNWFKKYYGKDIMAKLFAFVFIPIVLFLFVLGGLVWWIGILIWLACMVLFYIMRKNS